MTLHLACGEVPKMSYSFSRTDWGRFHWFVDNGKELDRLGGLYEAHFVRYFFYLLMSS